MEINPEMFVIPNEENYILYNPLGGSILEVTPAVVKQMQNLSFGKEYNLNPEVRNVLLKKGFVGEEFKKISNEVSFEEYKPTGVTLMPTWDCNLRCRYCYSHGGENPGEPLDINIAKSAIDFIIENSLEKKTRNVHVSYHGGGEPLLHKNMPWIKEITNYAKEKTKQNNLKLKVNSATNGFLAKKDLEWVVNNLNSISLSWDGPPEIQNIQRPGINGMPTYDSVLRTAKYLEETGFPYGIRSTISSFSVNKMEEIVKHFVENSNTKSFHLEPLFECGRGENDPVLKAPSSKDFSKNFIKARKIANENNRTLYHSASELKKIGRKFCGAAGNNFFVTPDGKVTTCLEVSRPEDDMADVFIVGEFDFSKGEFDFSEEKLSRLRRRIVDNVKGCNDCFAKYNCSGDCPAKSYSLSRDLYDSRNNTRCESNRDLLLHEIKEKLKNNGDVEKI